MMYIYIALGGALGACLRYFLVQQSTIWFGKDFPYGILLVNVLGSCVIGAVMGYLHTYSGEYETLIKGGVTVGLLGALTTFSTFSYDTVQLLHLGQWTKAILNIGANVLICTACTWFAFSLFKG